MRKHNYTQPVKCLIRIILLILINNHLTYSQKITELCEKGKWDKAEEKCMKLTGEEQQNAYRELAEAYLKADNIEKANEFYGKTKDPENGYLEIAEIYFSRKNYDKAREYYSKTNNPAKGYFKIAEVYFNRGDYEKSAEYYAVTDNPENGYLKIAEEYFKNAKYDKAAEYFSKTKNPVDGYFKIAEALFNIHDYEGAIEYYSKTNDPNAGYIMVAEAYFDKKDFKNAAKIYSKTDIRDEGHKKIAKVYYETWLKKPIDESKKAFSLNSDKTLYNKVVEMETFCNEKLYKSVIFESSLMYKINHMQKLLELLLLYDTNINLLNKNNTAINARINKHSSLTMNDIRGLQDYGLEKVNPDRDINISTFIFSMLNYLYDNNNFTVQNSHTDSYHFKRCVELLMSINSVLKGDTKIKDSVNDRFAAEGLTKYKSLIKL